MSKAITHNSLEWHMTRAHSRDLTVSIIVSSSIYSNFWSSENPSGEWIFFIEWAIRGIVAHTSCTKTLRVWERWWRQRKVSRSMTTDNNFWHLIKSVVKVTKEEKTIARLRRRRRRPLMLEEIAIKFFGQFAQAAGDLNGFDPCAKTLLNRWKLIFPETTAKSNLFSNLCFQTGPSALFDNLLSEPKKPVPLTPTDAEIHQLNRHWVAV